MCAYFMCHLQPFYYLGLELTLKELLRDAQLVQALGKARTTDNVNTWWGSSSYERLNRFVGGALAEPAPPTSVLPHHTLTVEMGFDFGQMYDGVNQSLGVLVIR